MKTTRWKMLGAVGLAVVIAGCGGSSASETAEPTASSASASAPSATESAPPATTADTIGPAETAPPTTDATEASPSAFAEDAELLTQWFSPFDSGTYRTNALGTPMSFVATEQLSTQPNGFGMFVLSDLSSQGPSDRDLVFLRSTSFADPATPNAPLAEQQGWPANDFAGWLDLVHDGLLVSEPVSTTVGGLDATFVEITLGDIECGLAPGACVGFVSNNGGDGKAFNPGSTHRIWMVDQGPEDPLAIVAGIQRDEDAAWFDRAGEVLESLAFGDVVANPVVAVTSTPTQLDVVGGVIATSPDDQLLRTMFTGRGYSTIGFEREPRIVDFVTTPLDFEGNRFASSRNC